jgi:hypothetical protein
MIETYFADIETAIARLAVVSSYSLTKKIYHTKQGFIEGTILFVDYSVLKFAEVKDSEKNEKIKYRYHYMSQQQELIFRYDNAKHYPKMATFPHHLHLPGQVVESTEPSLSDVLRKIERRLI